jgi:hypothetical protein
MISFRAELFSKAIPMSDLDEIGLYAQSLGGYFEVHRGWEVEFYVPQEYRDFILLKYPKLEEVAYVY